MWHKYQLFTFDLFQMLNLRGGHIAYEERIRHYLIPCIVNFCSAINNEEMWIHFNRDILMLLRREVVPQVCISPNKIQFRLIIFLKSSYICRSSKWSLTVGFVNITIICSIFHFLTHDENVSTKYCKRQHKII